MSKQEAEITGPSTDEEEVKNVEFNEKTQEKKHKKSKKTDNIEIIDDSDNSNDDDEDDDEIEEEEDDDDDDDDEDDGLDEEPLTDVTLYNVLGNFLIDEEGVNIAGALTNISKELAKLNHTLKKSMKKD